MAASTRQRSSPAFFALLTALVVMSVGPVFVMLSSSLKLNVDILDSTSGLLFAPTIRNYETVLCNVLWYSPAHIDYCDPTFGRALGNSIVIALVATVLTLLIGCLAAYGIVRFRFIGRGTVSITTLLMRMVPPAVLLVPVFGLWTFQFCFGNACLAGTRSGIAT